MTLIRRRPVSRFAPILVAFAALVSIHAATSPAFAQCGSDQLDSVPCCTPISAVLPVFPAITTSSRFVCFRDCATQIDQALCVVIDPPQPVNAGGIVCGLYTIKFKIQTCGTAQILWQGNLRAHYARNWREIDTTGLDVGVWRFLLNGDVKATAFLQGAAQWSSPNVQPGCYSTFNALYVSGYIDYAFDCASSTWTAAFVFNHDCDKIHHPGGSPRAGGAFHPTRSWTFLGPGTGFVVDPVTTVTAGGVSAAESMRWNDFSTLPNICRAEEQIVGQVTQLGSSCLCSSNPAAPGQYELTDIIVSGACGSVVRHQPGMQSWQKRIGQWTNPLVFPYVESVNLVHGDLDFSNACTLLVTPEFYEGVSTIGGAFATNYSGIVLGTQFMDIGSSNRAPNNMQIRIGVPHVTQSIVSIDIP